MLFAVAELFVLMLWMRRCSWQFGMYFIFRLETWFSCYYSVHVLDTCAHSKQVFWLCDVIHQSVTVILGDTGPQYRRAKESCMAGRRATVILYNWAMCLWCAVVAVAPLRWWPLTTIYLRSKLNNADYSRLACLPHRARPLLPTSHCLDHPYR